MTKVFISYSSKNRDHAYRLYAGLKKAGIECWMDALNIRPGTQWDRQINEALHTATHMIYLHTQDAYNSDNVWDEWSYFRNRQKPVIPVILEDGVELPYRLERLHFVDFVNTAFDKALKLLVRALVGEFTPDPDKLIRPVADDIEAEGVEQPRNSHDDQDTRLKLSAEVFWRTTPPGRGDFTIDPHASIKFDLLQTLLARLPTEAEWEYAAKRDENTQGTERERIHTDAERIVDAAFRQNKQFLPIHDLPNQAIDDAEDNHVTLYDGRVKDLPGHD